jgi:fibronectin type 3 domain-containing protein
MSPEVYVGLMASAGNDTDPSNDNWVSSATFTNVNITGQLNVPPIDNHLVAPSNVAASGISSTSVNLTWTHQTFWTGDFSQDGIVNAADYVMWRKNDGTSANYDNWRVTFGGAMPTVSRYWIERSSDGVNFQLVGATAPNEFTFTDFNLSGNQRYFYRVVAKDSAGVSVPSSIVNITTRAAAATNLKVFSVSPTQLMIEWKDSNGESNYKVQRSDDGSSGWTTIGTSARNSPFFVSSGLAANTRYFYRVITVDAGGDSATSAVISEFTRVNASPANFVVSGQTETSLTLSWDALPDMTRYSVYRGRDSDNNEWVRLDSNVTATTFTDTGLAPATEYHYRVFGVNANDGVTLKAEVFGSTAASTSLVSTAETQLSRVFFGPAPPFTLDYVHHRAFDEFSKRIGDRERVSRADSDLTSKLDAWQTTSDGRSTRRRLGTYHEPICTTSVTNTFSGAEGLSRRLQTKLTFDVEALKLAIASWDRSE